jgi:hypothetical protein
LSPKRSGIPRAVHDTVIAGGAPSVEKLEG